MAGGPSLRLYRAPFSTNCERVGLALAYKRIEVQSVLIDYADRTPVEAVSGQGLVPVIEDAGHVVSDSVAILRHLERTRPDPPLWPEDEPARARVDLFIEWFEGAWKPAPNAIEAALAGEAPDGEIAPLVARMRMHLDLFERLLAGGEHLLGEFGAADCVAYPFLKYARRRDPRDDELFHRILDEHQDVEGRPRLRQWIERMAERPLAYE